MFFMREPWKHRWQNPIADSPTTYASWCAMRARCYSPKSDNYSRYGAVGIGVCARWLDNYDAFVFDMGYRPEGTTLERDNPNGNYEPGNCRWATPAEQARNRKSNRMISFSGKTQPLVSWAEELGISRAALAARLRRMPPERALTLRGIYYDI